MKPLTKVILSSALAGLAPAFATSAVSVDAQLKPFKGRAGPPKIPETEDVPQELMDQIVDLVNKPRTTLNQQRLNKLLKRAGLEMPNGEFGKRKGRP